MVLVLPTKRTNTIIHVFVLTAILSYLPKPCSALAFHLFTLHGVLQRLGLEQLVTVRPGDAVVVTGASSGIGKHATLSLVKEGYTVFACVRRQTDGDALIQSAREFHQLDTSLLRVLMLDVTDPTDIARGVDTVSEFVGDRGLKGLFNSAGTSGGSEVECGAAEFVDMDVFRQAMEVNFFGTVQVTQAFLGLLRKGKGRIINNASVAGYIASPFSSYYAASKFAVEGFSDSLRREVLPFEVKVSVLECGFVLTPILTGYVPPSKEPYTAAEQSVYRAFWKDALETAPTPRASSQAVVHAMRAKNPQLRYVVGNSAAFVKALRFVPTGWLDKVMMGGAQVEFTERDRDLLFDKVNKEFEL